MTRDTAPKDRLDHAIDHVTARLVHVADDDEMAMRIVDVLPGRSRFGWLVPQLAALTAVAAAAIVWTTRPAPAPVVAELPSSYAIGLVALSSTVAAREPGTAGRTVPVEPVERLELLEPLEGERSLPSLMVSDVTPRELPVAPALELESIGVASIEVADLKLTAETFPQKEE